MESLEHQQDKVAVSVSGEGSNTAPWWRDTLEALGPPRTSPQPKGSNGEEAERLRWLMFQS